MKRGSLSYKTPSDRAYWSMQPAWDYNMILKRSRIFRLITVWNH